MGLNAEDTPVRALRSRTRDKLSSMLNRKKRILTSEGICRDYRGLALLMTESRPDVDFSYHSRIANHHHDPAADLLERSLHTLGELKSFLQCMDRYDVLEDCRDLFHADVNAYAEQLNKGMVFPVPAIRSPYLTVDDVIECGLKYDAFLLYADADHEFAASIVERLENPKEPLQRFNVCVKDRLLGTVIYEHRSIMTLIAEHCHHLIVLLSDDFVNDYEHMFFLDFAKYLALKHPEKSNFILPVVYKDCKLPPTWSCYYKLDFRRESKMFDFWKQLYKSVLRIPETRR